MSYGEIDVFGRRDAIRIPSIHRELRQAIMRLSSFHEEHDWSGKGWRRDSEESRQAMLVSPFCDRRVGLSRGILDTDNVRIRWGIERGDLRLRWKGLPQVLVWLISCEI